MNSPAEISGRDASSPEAQRTRWSALSNKGSFLSLSVEYAGIISCRVCTLRRDDEQGITVRCVSDGLLSFDRGSLSVVGNALHYAKAMISSREGRVIILSLRSPRLRWGFPPSREFNGPRPKISLTIRPRTISLVEAVLVGSASSGCHVQNRHVTLLAFVDSLIASYWLPKATAQDSSSFNCNSSQAIYRSTILEYCATGLPPCKAHSTCR